jgi:excisionase family DNA binding protein
MSAPRDGKTNLPAPAFWRYREAAAWLGLPMATLRTLVARGQVPHRRISERIVLFAPEELRAWMAARRVGGAP